MSATQHTRYRIASGTNHFYIVDSDAGLHVAKSIGDSVESKERIETLIATLNAAPQLAEALRAAASKLELIEHGWAQGHIKSKPIMTGMDDPEATEYGMKSLGEVVSDAAKAARAALAKLETEVKP